MKANRKQNAVKLTGSKPNRAKRKQNKENTVQTALVQYSQDSSIHEVTHMKLIINNVG